jgi:hypothetical protein
MGLFSIFCVRALPRARPWRGGDVRGGCLSGC